MKELWISVLTICFILAVSKVTTYGGLSSAMGQGIAKAGSIFPLLSPVLGWIGVFMTGSVVNNNALFAPIQASVALDKLVLKGHYLWQLTLLVVLRLKLYHLNL